MFFSIAIVLLFIEIFLTPGFGFIGFSGIVMLLLGVISLYYPDVQNIILTNIEWFVVAIAAFGLLFYLTRREVAKYLFYKNPLVLQEGIVPLEKEEFLVPGMFGIAKTPFRPSGKIEILGTMYDAISNGVYIPEGAEIKIVRIEGCKIIISEA